MTRVLGFYVGLVLVNLACFLPLYLLNFRESLYGCDLVVEFVARLRPEKRFAVVQDLIVQIEQDIVDARAVLDAYAPPQNR